MEPTGKNHCYFCSQPCDSSFQACPEHKLQVTEEYIQFMKDIYIAKERKHFQERFVEKKAISFKRIPKIFRA